MEEKAEKTADTMSKGRKNSGPSSWVKGPFRGLTGSNDRPLDLQSNALPTELFRHVSLKLEIFFAMKVLMLKPYPGNFKTEFH